MNKIVKDIKDKLTNIEKYRYLQEFLTFKDIEIDEQEFNDFIESRMLADKLTDKADLLSIDITINENIGVGIINKNAIAKMNTDFKNAVKAW